MRHIVALSGGKDSTALACWLHANEPREYLWVCTPTGNELPEMVNHWLGLGRVLGKPPSLAELGERFAKGEIPRGAGEPDLFGGRKSMCRVCSL